MRVPQVKWWVAFSANPYHHIKMKACILLFYMQGKAHGSTHRCRGVGKWYALGSSKRIGLHQHGGSHLWSQHLRGQGGGNSTNQALLELQREFQATDAGPCTRDLTRPEPSGATPHTLGLRYLWGDGTAHEIFIFVLFQSCICLRYKGNEILILNFSNFG